MDNFPLQHQRNNMNNTNALGSLEMLFNNLIYHLSYHIVQNSGNSFSTFLHKSKVRKTLMIIYNQETINQNDYHRKKIYSTPYNSQKMYP